VRRFIGLDPMATPAVLVAGHAPFTWGKTPMERAQRRDSGVRSAHGIYHNCSASGGCGRFTALLDRHYFRKHGADATYGQK